MDKKVVSVRYDFFGGLGGVVYYPRGVFLLSEESLLLYFVRQFKSFPPTRIPITPKACISSATCCGFLVKYSAYAECEIIHCVNCEISHGAYGFGRCEIKFASSHLRSKYFTAKLFHMAKPYFTRRRRISLKKKHTLSWQTNVCFFLVERVSP